jgi:hypothetical protein
VDALSTYTDLSLITDLCVTIGRSNCINIILIQIILRRILQSQIEIECRTTEFVGTEYIEEYTLAVEHSLYQTKLQYMGHIEKLELKKKIGLLELN